MSNLQIVTTPDGRALEHDGQQIPLPALAVDAIVHAYATPAGLWAGVQKPGEPRPVYPGGGGQKLGSVELEADAVALLEAERNRKQADLNAARDDAFAAGILYQFDNGDDVVQTRPQDQINLIGLSVKAQRQIAAGDNTPMPFRGLSNETRLLEPREMDAMAMTALAHIEGIYARSWARKDAVDAATTQAEIDAISWEVGSEDPA